MTPSPQHLALLQLDSIWDNIRHNETMRNRFFQMYMLIAASFLALLQASSGFFSSRGAVLVCTGFVYGLGLVFLWSYERIGEMIARDNRIVGIIDEALREGSPLDQRVLRERRAYVTSVRTTVSKWWSISSCVKLSTSTMSAAILAIGLVQYLDLSKRWILFLAPVLVGANLGAIFLMNLAAGIRIGGPGAVGGDVGLSAESDG